MKIAADVVILGAGMAGCSAALWCHRLDMSFVWLERQAEIGGQLARVFNPIPDYAGLPAANGAEIKRHLAAQLDALGIAPLLGVAIAEVDAANARLTAQDGRMFEGQALILATGVEQRRLGVPGELELLGKGVGVSATRERYQYEGQAVAIVGGGDAACENALLLAEVSPRVALVHRRSTFRARPALLAQVHAEPRIEVILDARVKAILGTDHVEGLRIDTPTGERTLDARGVFVRIGVGPVSGLVQRQLRCDPDGYLLVDADQRTSDPHVFAIGDVCNPIYSSLAVCSGEGMVAAKAISRALAAGR